MGLFNSKKIVKANAEVRAMDDNVNIVSCIEKCDRIIEAIKENGKGLTEMIGLVKAMGVMSDGE